MPEVNALVLTYKLGVPPKVPHFTPLGEVWKQKLIVCWCLSPTALSSSLESGGFCGASLRVLVSREIS